MEEFALFLEKKQIVAQEYDFKKGSTIGVGGQGRAVFPRSFTECIEVIDECERLEIPFRVLGNLSNVLPPERADETVYIITKGLCGITMGESPLVHAGVMAKDLLTACKRHGRSGADFLAGIPCTIGGAAFMNAGVSGRYFSEVVRSVIAYENGELKTYSKEECDYSYKHSRFMQGGVIFGVILDLKDSTTEHVCEEVDVYLERRRRLPKGKSMGCIFMNPEGMFAGELIEKAGLKGLRQGGAVVSNQHANFIINDQGASASDIRCLIEKIKKTVYQRFGVHLTEEIRYL